MGVRRRGQGYGPAPNEGPAPRPAPAGRTPPTLAFSGAQGLRKGAKDGRRGRTTGAEAQPPGRVGPEGPSALGASSRRRPSPWTEPTPCCGQRGEGRRLPRTRSSRPGRRRPIGPRPRPAASPEGRVRLTGVGAAVPPPTGTRAGARPDRPASIPSPAHPRPRPPRGGKDRSRAGPGRADPGAPPALSPTSVLGRHGPSRGLPAPALGRAGGSGCAHPLPPERRRTRPPASRREGGVGLGKAAGGSGPSEPRGCPGGNRRRDGHGALGSDRVAPPLKARAAAGP